MVQFSEKWRSRIFFTPGGLQKCCRDFGFKTITSKLDAQDAVYPGADALRRGFRTTWLPYTQRVPENVREEFYRRRHGTVTWPNTRRIWAGRVRVRMVRLKIDAVKV